jgi:hypothetical protein
MAKAKYFDHMLISYKKLTKNTNHQSIKRNKQLIKFYVLFYDFNLNQYYSKLFLQELDKANNIIIYSLKYQLYI